MTVPVDVSRSSKHNVPDASGPCALLRVQISSTALHRLQTQPTPALLRSLHPAIKVPFMKETRFLEGKSDMPSVLDP